MASELTRAAVWDEIIYVAVHSPTDKFVLEAMDYQHQSKDRTLGTTELSAAGFLREGTDPIKMPWLGTGKKSLRESLRSDNKKTVKGAIEFEAEFVRWLDDESRWRAVRFGLLRCVHPLRS